ncbi:hypothetical protein HPB48_004896 [Haemaphysalis longicornis]|uniref:Transglutaminase-like domain-containing protein n=1 Tax=Haemaphysalis longicornis TaxID=44386 RepID=A0A9J6GEC0_HAELO|nr:hypothetical protein HPB48_004896 [Haemaphysalis longicornis]
MPGLSTLFREFDLEPVLLRLRRVGVLERSLGRPRCSVEPLLVACSSAWRLACSSVEGSQTTSLCFRYDWKHMETKQSPDEVFSSKLGVCKDYCLLFSEMCRLAGIREKTVQGFAKGFDYRPGHQFLPGQDVTHAWSAVFILGAWRLIDTTWGTGYTDHTGKFIRKTNEHFFMTDPEVLIWTHFPYDEMEKNYSRWQLVDKPLTLDEFNTLPKVTPQFFQLNMRIRTRPQNPIVFRVRTELRLASHEPMRYKFKLYPSDEVENATLNNYVFCHLLEDRTVACFGVTPPTEGRYLLKIYANRERDMKGTTVTFEGPAAAAAAAGASLQNIGVFMLDCLRAKKYLMPYPLNEVPWGPTQTFYDYNMKLVDQTGPVIVSWGAKRKLTIDLSETMLVSHQLLDADGVEMDLKGMITREDKDRRVTFPDRAAACGHVQAGHIRHAQAQAEGESGGCRWWPLSSSTASSPGYSWTKSCGWRTTDRRSRRKTKRRRRKKKRTDGSEYRPCDELVERAEIRGYGEN